MKLNIILAMLAEEVYLIQIRKCNTSSSYYTLHLDNRK